jgi:hypothetical protein
LEANPEKETSFLEVPELEFPDFDDEMDDVQPDNGRYGLSKIIVAYHIVVAA